MKRREFIALLGGTAATCPLMARAQQSAMPVVGHLSTRAADEDSYLLTAFRSGLSEAGYVEDRNVRLEFRWAAGKYDQLPALAADLVHRQVSVIAATGGIASVLAAKAATATIPIVFYVGVNPVEFGLITSLNRPGGNLTGVTSLAIEVGPKRLEFLHELVPKAKNIALLANPSNPNTETLSKDLEAATRTLGLQCYVVYANGDSDLDTVFVKLAHIKTDALVIAPDAFFTSRNDKIAALALRYRIPTAYEYRAFAAAGGLLSYGGSNTDSYYQVGIYTGRILKGEEPANLPVHQSTKVELIINLKTAKALNLEVPPSLLGRADEVIE